MSQQNPIAPLSEGEETELRAKWNRHAINVYSAALCEMIAEAGVADVPRILATLDAQRARADAATKRVAALKAAFQWFADGCDEADYCNPDLHFCAGEGNEHAVVLLAALEKNDA